MATHHGSLATFRTTLGPAIGVLLIAAATVALATLVGVFVLGPP